jgi:hypothetical protein
MKDSFFLDVFFLAPFIQYPITILIFIFSLRHINKINTTDIVIVLLLINLGILSYTFGSFKGFPVNIRAILVPIIFIVVLNSNAHKYLKPLFIYCLLIVIIEYIFYYSGLVFWRDLTRFGLLRPYGGLFDTHSNSLFLAISLYLFGFPILGGTIALLMMTLQTPIAYAVLFFNKKNIILFAIFASFTLLALYKIGHLDIDNKVSMMSVYNASFNIEYNHCFLLGCASNIILIESTQNLANINDNGLVRTSYFFGILWLFFYFILLYRNCKSKALPIVYFVTILHYPVAFGIVNTAIIGISINYFNNITYFRKSINKNKFTKIRGKAH